MSRGGRVVISESAIGDQGKWQSRTGGRMEYWNSDWWASANPFPFHHHSSIPSFRSPPFGCQVSDAESRASKIALALQDQFQCVQEIRPRFGKCFALRDCGENFLHEAGISAPSLAGSKTAVTFMPVDYNSPVSLQTRLVDVRPARVHQPQTVDPGTRDGSDGVYHPTRRELSTAGNFLSSGRSTKAAP